MGKKVLVSVINDLVTDQRVHKVCLSLTSMGFEVVLIGRILPDSMPMDSRPYKSHRMRLMFRKGAFFYAEYNIRLFFHLLFSKTNLLVSNDLDTLLTNYLISSLKSKPLVYDSHEYFTEVPELVSRPNIQRVWKRIEAWIFPKLKDVITVNDSIADLFEKDYGIRPKVVRNIPFKKDVSIPAKRSDLGLPDDSKILILQGSGINIHRGSEEMVEAMKYLDGVKLLIVGGGDVLELLKDMANKDGIKGKVIFRPRQPYEMLMQYTSIADIGLTLDKDTNLNYRFSLPNKLFDYIHSGIPVLSSDLPEIRKIIDEFEIGDFIPDHNPETIAKKVKEVLANEDLLDKWKKNIIFAARNLSWQNEEKV
ncbi:MAG: glycosyltransferase, partial [Marinilabiliales bacterium]